jgi:hypothetical protein
MNKEKTCRCTTRHIPKPIELVETNEVWLCPTSAGNLGVLMLEWLKHGGEPPGWITKHYSAYIRRLAKENYEAGK